LVFRKAEPIVGGREFVVDTETGKLEAGAQKASMNNFQGRYAIRHEGDGPGACMNPRRHGWGGPPRGEDSPGGVTRAPALAVAPRGEIKLPEVVKRDIPELDIKAKKAGCGCHTSDPAGLAAGLALVALGIRRPSRRRGRRIG